jgi:hypothetical protein
MKKVILIVVVALAVIGAGAALFVYDAKHPELKNPWANKSTRDLALTCLDQEYTDQHIHPNLTITINGQKQEVPGNIGIQSNCLHPLHTHDNTGKVHVESPEARDYTLGDFFAVWGKSFSKDQIFDSKADAMHRIRMTVNGQENAEYEKLVLKDLDDIQVYYETVQ